MHCICMPLSLDIQVFILREQTLCFALVVICFLLCCCAPSHRRPHLPMQLIVMPQTLTRGSIKANEAWEDMRGRRGIKPNEGEDDITSIRLRRFVVPELLQNFLQHFNHVKRIEEKKKSHNHHRSLRFNSS